ncbi:MAG: xanthine dehydrogenase family protein molybdopterin-binding subunit [Candidatus Tectomicrobia bacterium]|nr:xanthine dehydrogenase family protein molybdopterin-binding subunit [Candidatus Tectomicrobia bacterium]
MGRLTDGYEKVTGVARYGADIEHANCLAGMVLRSEHPHARLRSIDTRRAEALPGVKAVITAADAPQVLHGFTVHDQTIIARERVRYVGEPVAAVAAVDKATASEALRLIRVEYEPLPAVFTPHDALRSDAPLLHPNFAAYESKVPLNRYGNVCCHAKITNGEVARGFDRSAVIIENTFKTPHVHFGYIEPHAVSAAVDGRGFLTVWTSTQAPFVARAALSHTLKLPMHQVRVIGTAIGGGFGGKVELLDEPLAALLAIKARRAVRIEMSMLEDFHVAQARHASEITLKAGISSDGMLQAFEGTVIMDTGAYAGFGPHTTSQAMVLLGSPYRVPHLRFEGFAVLTNKLNCGALRAPGGPQAALACESTIDMLAEKIGMDPFEVRLKNAKRSGDTTPTGCELRAVALEQTLRAAAERFDWRRAVQRPSNGKLRGKGMACGIWGGSGYGAGATVRVNEDGTATVFTGAVETGAGSTIVATQIVAEELGLGVEDVHVVCGDTESTPFDMGAIGSRTTVSTGQALRQAAVDAKRKILQEAAEQLETRLDDLELRGRQVLVKGVPSRAVPLREITTTLTMKHGGPVMGLGACVMELPGFDAATYESHTLPSKPWFTFGTQMVEVEVDPASGDVEIIRFVAAHDVGRAINPVGIEGQIHGAVTLALGQAFSEQLVFQQGRLMNPNFLDYRMPTALETPHIETIIIEAADEESAYGVKGVGEPPVPPVIPAIANAIYNATGARILELPLSPERVWLALQKVAR